MGAMNIVEEVTVEEIKETREKGGRKPRRRVQVEEEGEEEGGNTSLRWRATSCAAFDRASKILALLTSDLPDREPP